jgi:hypothetical protein
VGPLIDGISLTLMMFTVVVATVERPEPIAPPSQTFTLSE